MIERVLNPRVVVEGLANTWKRRLCCHLALVVTVIEEDVVVVVVVVVGMVAMGTLFFP
jgi:hypothetical protein